MHIDGKISYNELEQLVFILKSNIERAYLQNIYHHNNLWMLKFNKKLSIVYEHGAGLWIGEFKEREKNLHSISIKLRKEIRGKKMFHLNIIENDKTIILDFGANKLVIELYSKGNIILLDSENKVLVLTRPNTNCYHGMIYELGNYKDYKDYQIKKFGWKKKDIELSEDGEIFENFMVGLEKLWDIKYTKKSLNLKKNVKNNKKTAKDHIGSQIKNFDKKISKKIKKIEEIENNFESIDYKELEKLYSDKKKLDNKKKRAKEVFDKTKKVEIKKKKKVIPKIKLNTKGWYHKYYWWYTKNGFLVVGGRNATDNEKLVKTYLEDNDYYFHTDDAGSGSFIMKTEKKEPNILDLDETAEGVLALSNQWNSSFSSGDVFYVKGNQVSKTPPAGEYVSKGSFMIYGKKEYIKVDRCELGYGIYKNQLMLAPYRIISRLKGEKIKLKPRSDIKKMRGKIISNAIKKRFNVELNDDISLFNKPSYIF